MWRSATPTLFLIERYRINLVSVENLLVSGKFLVAEDGGRCRSFWRDMCA